MQGYETLSLLTRERIAQREQEGRAERLARELRESSTSARGTRRRRLSLTAGLGRGIRRGAARA